MAFKQSLVQRLFAVSRVSNQASRSCRFWPATFSAVPPEPDKVSPDRGEETMFRKFLQRRPLYQLAASVPELRYMPTGRKLLERLRDMGNVGGRIRLEGLVPPAEAKEGGLTVDDARKVLKVSQLEMVKAKLRQTGKNCLPYADYVKICEEECMSRDLGMEFAKMLDDSGSVIVLGNVVFLKPEQEGK